MSKYLLNINPCSYSSLPRRSGGGWNYFCCCFPYPPTLEVVATQCINPVLRHLHASLRGSAGYCRIWKKSKLNFSFLREIALLNSKCPRPGSRCPPYVASGGQCDCMAPKHSRTIIVLGVAQAQLEGDLQPDRSRAYTGFN